MTFLEAIYGSQYYEIHQKGRDGNKGRLNGNLFLSVFVLLILITVLLLSISFIPGFDDRLSRSVKNIFGEMRGKDIGKLLAIPVLAIIYFVIAQTIGNTYRFKKYVDTFMQYPDEIKKKANVKILLPFFIILAIVFGLAITKL